MIELSSNISVCQSQIFLEAFEGYHAYTYLLFTKPFDFHVNAFNAKYYLVILSALKSRFIHVITWYVKSVNVLLIIVWVRTSNYGLVTNVLLEDCQSASMTGQIKAVAIENFIGANQLKKTELFRTEGKQK